MAGSPFFKRIREQVLLIVAAIPEGRVATFSDIGDWLDVVPRHVAYILAELDPLSQDLYPWHRAVAADGRVKPGKSDHTGMSQRQRLEAEGLVFSAGGEIMAFDAVRIGIEALAIDLPRQRRPENAPKAAPSRPRRPRPK